MDESVVYVCGWVGLVVRVGKVGVRWDCGVMRGEVGEGRRYGGGHTKI